MLSHLSMESNSISLFPWQEKAVNRLRSGNILCGGVGSGKTFTSLVYFQRNFADRNLVVITTAKKRDTGDWQRDTSKLGIRNVQVDSWNNLKKYSDISGAFFIFDEQRVVGYGSWAKNFIKISKSNKWILLSATPGDTWLNYIPVFIANGWYKNKTAFMERHVEYDRFAKFPKVKKFHNTGILKSYRDRILVPMPHQKKTYRMRIREKTGYSKELYAILNKRMNPYSNEPIENPSEFTQTARRIVSTSQDRIDTFRSLVMKINRVIVFYNYNYELDVILNVLANSGKPYSQWNGAKHEEIPEGNSWVYVVQYTAGAEAWECTYANSMIFYSPNYSYKIVEQAEGRIDRMNNRFLLLFYYYLYSDAPIDKAVLKSLDGKKKFNESAWAKEVGPYS